MRSQHIRKSHSEGALLQVLAMQDMVCHLRRRSSEWNAQKGYLIRLDHEESSDELAPHEYQHCMAVTDPALHSVTYRNPGFEKMYIVIGQSTKRDSRSFMK